MKRMIRPIFTKTIILLMTFFVCLPCFAKQEIKQILEIPFVHLENSEKSNKNLLCQSFTKKGKINLSFSNPQKHIQKCNYNCGEIVSLRNSLQANFSPFLNLKIASVVPIYILHEQYLI